VSAAAGEFLYLFLFCRLRLLSGSEMEGDREVCRGGAFLTSLAFLCDKGLGDEAFRFFLSRVT
jgi:hypothetical protein